MQTSITKNTERPVTRSMTKKRRRTEEKVDLLSKSTHKSVPKEKFSFEGTELPPEISLQIASLQERILEPLVKKLLHSHQLKVLPKGTELSEELVSKFSKKHKSNKKNKLSEQVVSDLPLNYVSERRDMASSLNYTYSHTLDRTPYPTNQMHSGRCWLFAGLNSIRLELIKQFNLPDHFELSQSHLFFHDKFERCNYLMEELISLRDRDYNDEVVHALMGYASTLDDGGHWSFFKNLVTKYGVMPKNNYEESYNTSYTNTMNEVLKKKVTQFLLETKDSSLTDEQLRELKDNKFLPDIYSLLCKFMGEPPSKFDWSYYEDNYGHNGAKTQRVLKDLTPVQFYQEFVEPSYNIEQKIMIVHDPREERALYNHYRVPYSANMVGGDPNILVTVSLDDMKEAAIRSIKAHKSMWIACDVGKDFNHDRDLLSTEIFDYDLALNTKLGMSKADQLKYRVSCPSHAMLLVGVDLDEATKPRKWRIENSWGAEAGHDPGYLQMSDKWFDNYMYYLVVDRQFLSEEVLEAINENDLEVSDIPFNDPFGAVAKN